MREQGVSYDVDRFIYLGTPEHENHAVIYTKKELGLDSPEKLKTKPGIRIGGQTVGHTSYVAGRLFAYFLDLKDPKFVVGYTSQEVDVALMNGELDARANAAISVLRRNPEWLDKGVMNFHAIMEVPKGDKHPRLSHLPEIESFAKTDQKKKSSPSGALSEASAPPTSCLRRHPKTGSRYSKRLCARPLEIQSLQNISKNWSTTILRRSERRT